VFVAEASLEGFLWRCETPHLTSPARGEGLLFRIPCGWAEAQSQASAASLFIPHTLWLG